MKDRAALVIVLDAERRGVLHPGGIIVEGTAGNTGIGLALVANARGYRTVIVIPDTQSQEKKDTLRVCGAVLYEVPAVPYRDPNNYVHVAGTPGGGAREEEPTGAIWAQQFDNVANRARPLQHHRTGDLGADGRQGGWLHLRSRYGRHAGGRGRWRCASAIRTSRSASPIRRAPRSTAITRAASSRRKARPSPRASARAASLAT